jgi:hypothetical protein
LLRQHHTPGQLNSTLFRRQERLRTHHRIRFVPAWWLLAALVVLRVWLSGGTFGKLGAARLVWSLAPRKLKLLTGGFAAVTLLLTAGAAATLALLAMYVT